MIGRERRKHVKNGAFILDMMHIVIGLLIVVLGIFSFLDPEGNMLLFPLIFLLASVLNIANGTNRIRLSGRDKKKKTAGITILVLGILLAVLAFVSALSIW